MCQRFTQQVTPEVDEHDMDKIHGITQHGITAYPAAERIVSLPLDTTYQREHGIGHQHHIRATETPTDFQIGDAGYTLQPILVNCYREEITSHQQQQGITHRQGTVSLDVITQHEVSGKAREVMEHRRRIHPTLRETKDEYKVREW